MPINWFPGHMNKARRVIAEQMARSDMMIEVLDARLPRSSQNPLLTRIRRHKPCLQLLTKPDMADPRVTAQWLATLKSSRVQPMEIVATSQGAAKRVVEACRALVPERGHPGFPVRVMIVGIPNVGKSTLFNSLVGKRKAEVRNQPAVTRSNQQIELPGGVLLTDTPGVLWPKFADPAGAYRLAASGAIRDSVIDTVDVARYLVEFLARRYPSEFARRFRLADVSNPNPDVLLEAVAVRRGCLTKGVGPDLRKASELVIHELRAGAIGRISLESPEDLRVQLHSKSAPDDTAEAEDVDAADDSVDEDLNEDGEPSWENDDEAGTWEDDESAREAD